MSTFAQLNLHADIFKAIDACGYTTPTPIQAESIPLILNGNDVIASAQTGTGKTASFVLPALHRLCMQAATKNTRILILTPTRELASQITKAASTYGKFLRFNIVSLVGGMSYHHQIKDLSRGANIIVATPGRLIDHMENNRVNLSNIEMLVLDEADRMLDMGFIDDVQFIAEQTPADRQTLLFSATVDNKLASAVRHLLKDPKRIDLSQKKLAAPKIQQEFYKVSNLQHKSRLLSHLLANENIFKAIIFSATKMNADKLAYQLRAEGFEAAALHGDLKQNVRNRTVDQLRRGKIQFLVATDVAARGLDIQDITHVINYDLPRFSEDYVHRIGRTGRAGKTGVAISFVLPLDAKHLRNIERYVGQHFKVLPAPEVKAVERNPVENTINENREHGKQEQGAKKFQSRNISWDRDDDLRPARRENKFSRDDNRRSSRGESRFSRDDRPKHVEGRFSRDDKRSSSRGESRFSRDDRPKHADSKFSRDDKRSSSRGESRFSRDDRPKHADSKFSRDDKRSSSRGESRFSSDDRPKHADGKFAREDKHSSSRGDDRFSRGDKRSASGKPPRQDKKKFSSRQERRSVNDFADKPMKNKTARDKK